MTTLEKIRAEITELFKASGVSNSSLCFAVLQLFDKYAEQEPSRDIKEIAEIMKCGADAETKCKMISNILTAKPHYFAEQEPTDEWQNGYDMAWEEAEVFYEKEEPQSPCDLCRYDYLDGVCGDCPAMAKGGE